VRGDEPLVLQPPERRIERALLDLQHVAADVLQPLGDPVPMLVLDDQRLEDQQAERALQHATSIARHTCS
jgi:hypothetical protein